MPRKRPISDIVDVKDLAGDTNPSPSKRQRPVTSKLMTSGITFPILIIPQQSTDLTPVISRNRPLSDLQDSIDETIQPTKKKSTNGLSDSMSEAFHLLSDSSDSETDSTNEIFNSFVKNGHDSTRSTDHATITDEFVPYSKTHTKIIYQDDININDGSVECLSTEPCKKHEPVDPDIIYPNPEYEPYYLPQLENTPLRCDGEINTLISTMHLYPAIQRTIRCDGRFNISLYTEEIKTLFKTQQKDIHLSRTVNVGPCYMTMFVLRQKNLIKKSTKTKLPPLIVGPVLLHFDRSLETYVEFLMGIQFVFDLPRDILKMTIKGVPKNDRPLVQAMRNIFGTCMNLVGRHHCTGSIRSDMHYGNGRIKYNAPIVAAVSYVQERIYKKQNECMRKALFGEYTEDYALTERAKEYASQWFSGSGAYQKFLELVPE